ncbi:MAG: DUF4124 domain-containing protein [Pseudomonadota bacterium]|nr:DUF4124 domain-containing protein [Pseudomonadota bacterium]
MPRIKAISALLAVLLSAPAHAEVYRWIDDKGSVHFSDTPPQAIRHRTLDIQAPVTVPMNDNIRQSEKVRQNRNAVSAMLTPESSDRFGANAKQSRAQQAACVKLQKQLDRVQSQLRSGYSNDRGNSLRQKRRTLSQRHSRECMLN